MRHDEFIAATASLNRDNLGANGGWQRYSIRAAISGDRKLGCSTARVAEPTSGSTTRSRSNTRPEMLQSKTSISLAPLSAQWSGQEKS
jgi:hypothetical protein